MCEICVCTAFRKTEERNYFVGKEDSETKRVLRRVQMCIDEYLENHILNKSESILISILNVI